MRNVLAAFCLFAVAGIAQASLIGDTIEGEYTVAGGSNLFDPPTAVVGDGVEFELSAEFSPETFGIGEYDFDGESLWVTYDLSAGQTVLFVFAHDVTFSDLDWFDDAGNPIDGEIVGFELVSGSAPELLDYSFTSDGLSLSWDTIRLDGPSTRLIELHFDILVEHGTPQVPEPATIALFGLGMAGLVARRMRKSA